MKKSITFLFALCSIVSFAQSIRVIQGNTDVTGTTVIEKIILREYIETRFKLYNSSDREKKFQITRIIKSTPRLDYYIGPFVGCHEYAPMPDSIFIIPETIAVKAKDYFQELNPHCFSLGVYLFADNECKDYIVSFVIWDVDGGKDSSEVTIHYTCVNGINEEQAGIFSVPYPNPAHSVATIDYTFHQPSKKNKLVLYNMIGESVSEIFLDNSNGKVHIDLHALHSGLYFYSFTRDAQILHSGKLFISDH